MIQPSNAKRIGYECGAVAGAGHGGLFRRSITLAERERAEELLEFVGIAHLAYEGTRNLSVRIEIMKIAKFYLANGYAIVRQCIPVESAAEIRLLVTAMDITKRKPNLIENAQLRQALDDMLKPLYAGMGIQVERLVELALLIATQSRPVKLGWHRDRPPDSGIHSFQLPLLPGDRFHELVPRSHNRELTAAEIAARNAGGQDMPGAVNIELDVGDILLRSPLIFHRGYNENGIERLTIVGTYA